MVLARAVPSGSALQPSLVATSAALNVNPRLAHRRCSSSRQSPNRHDNSGGNRGIYTHSRSHLYHCSKISGGAPSTSGLLKTKSTVPVFHSKAFSSSARTEASVKDPYATLGVKRDASSKDIKGAYYDLAKKYHPDTSKEKGAKERFVEIQAAYDILSDEKKKAAFDRYGTTDGQPGFNPFGGEGGGAGFDPFGGGGFGGFGGFQGFSGGTRDASDIFEGLFGAAFGGRGRSGPGFAGEARGEDLETNINVTFEEACRGTTKRVTIAPVERCSTCDGGGMKKGAQKRTCGICNGTGTRTFVIQSGFQMASTCPACNGAGQTVAPGDECGSCDGVGRVRTRKSVDVKVPAGVDDGAKIRMEGQGDVPLQGAGSAGSLYVRISVRPSKVWRRQGSNLYFPATIPFHTAILGGRVRVPTLDGNVDVRVPAGTQVGDEMLLRGRGVPSLLRRGEKGDLLVQFEVQIPRNLSKRQKEILQQYADDIEGRTTSTPQSHPEENKTESGGQTSKLPQENNDVPPSPKKESSPHQYKKGNPLSKETEDSPEAKDAEDTQKGKSSASSFDEGNTKIGRQDEPKSCAPDKRGSEGSTVRSTHSDLHPRRGFVRSVLNWLQGL